MLLPQIHFTVQKLAVQEKENQKNLGLWEEED